MKISYKPLWKTWIDKNGSKRERMRQTNLITNHIANMGKGKHIPLVSVVKIYETLNGHLVEILRKQAYM